MVWSCAKMPLTIAPVLLLLANGLKAYEPNWDSLDSRPLPAWYDEAKFGIFMHWGLYSVPSFGQSAEWFWWWWEGNNQSSHRDFMQKNFKQNFSYADFAPMFTCENFDPDRFAAVVKSSGAKYFVFTSKHHDGFAMWPSKYSWNYNSKDVGPHRDIVGELAESIRKTGVRFGLYYSLFEWFHPLFRLDSDNGFATQFYVHQVAAPQLREIVELYQPEILWSDGDSVASVEYWNSTGFLAWLYNESPVNETVVTNDRWGIGTACRHGGFYTCNDRYNPGQLVSHKWENCYTIDKNSWGFRRDAVLADYLTSEELLQTFIQTVSCGGNFLLNVGPTHDGRIVPIFEERLNDIGKWLEINGEAIFQTTPWTVQNDTLTPNVWYTSRSKLKIATCRRGVTISNKKVVVYAHFFDWPLDGELRMGSVSFTKSAIVEMLGYPGKLVSDKLPEGGTKVYLPKATGNTLLPRCCWVLKLDFPASVSYSRC